MISKTARSIIRHIWKDNPDRSVLILLINLYKENSIYICMRSVISMIYYMMNPWILTA